MSVCSKWLLWGSQCCGGSHRMLEFALAVVDFIVNCRSHCLLWVTQLVAIVADSGCCGSHRQL